MKTRLHTSSQIKLPHGRPRSNVFNEPRVRLNQNQSTEPSPVDGDFRLLENSDFRITESGDFRTLE